MLAPFRAFYLDAHRKLIEDTRILAYKNYNVELAKMWRTERSLQKLEAMLIVADKSKILLISGDGNVIEPENDVLAIGSGGNYAYSAALAYLECSNYSAKEIAEKSLSIAGNICIYTNHNVTAEVLE